MCVTPKHLVSSAAHCPLQQTIANVSQIKDIEERIQSLEALASPVSEQDVEEKARREVLRKYVLQRQEAQARY